MEGAPGQDHGLSPRALRPDEVVTYHWTAPGGQGVLTNLRCLLLSHPHPVHRSVTWVVDLERVSELMVDQRWGLGVTFAVLVNKRVVYVGDPNPCAELQRRIDDARTARCMSVFGRLLPYEPGPPTRGDYALGGEFAPTFEVPAAGDATALSGAFLLFLAGERFQDGVPGGTHPVLTAVFVRGVGTGTTIGGHEPADAQPGQIYGRQAEMGRMVLDLATRCGATVKVVDVDRPGADLPLVERWVTPDADLPLLVRPDGARLEGAASFVPSKVAAFLQGR